ncbi:DUF4956 domain-containing protein [Acetoanaerobium noterae]|uniref:DUF4956 domain-containing protein n=1 Tax=Acetoanaerobium noterae TaxID=745369 RepID=UPI00322189B3
MTTELLYSAAINNFNESFSVIQNFGLGMVVSCSLGYFISIIYKYKNSYSKSFVITLALLPMIVQTVITLVNGNLGTGVAVMGAFSLIRFRSAPGGAKEITAIFMAMAVGLAVGTGYYLLAFVFVLLIGTANIVYEKLDIGKSKENEKLLKITIPEDLDYETLFDDILNEYLNSWELIQVKTTDMGSLFKLSYQVCFKENVSSKAFIDELRCRNGNLEIALSRSLIKDNEL